MELDIRKSNLQRFRKSYKGPAYIETEESLKCPYCGNKLISHTVNGSWSVEFCGNPNCKEKVEEEKIVLEKLSQAFKNYEMAQSDLLTLTNIYDNVLNKNTVEDFVNQKIEELKSQEKKLEEHLKANL